MRTVFRRSCSSEYRQVHRLQASNITILHTNGPHIKSRSQTFPNRRYTHGLVDDSLVLPESSRHSTCGAKENRAGINTSPSLLAKRPTDSMPQFLNEASRGYLLRNSSYLRGSSAWAWQPQLGRPNAAIACKCLGAAKQRQCTHHPCPNLRNHGFGMRSILRDFRIRGARHYHYRRARTRLPDDSAKGFPSSAGFNLKEDCAGRAYHDHTIRNPNFRPLVEKHLQPSKQLFKKNFTFSTTSRNGSEPSGVSDEFCSRLFATRAFSVSSIIKYLKLFESQIIGPLALREIVNRARDDSQMLEYLTVLRQSGLEIQKCVFSDAALQFVNGRQFDLIRSLAQSDVHHEAFEDILLQKKLLSLYTANGDIVSARRTKALLDLSHGECKAVFESTQGQDCNALFCRLCREKDFEQLQHLVEDMIMKRIVIRETSLEALQSCIPHVHETWNGRPRGNALRMVANIIIRVFDSGGDIPTGLWKQLLVHFGDRHDFRNLTVICLTLAHSHGRKDIYHSTSQHIRLHNPQANTIHKTNTSQPGRPDLANNVVDTILDDRLVSSIVGWGFQWGKSLLWHRILKPSPNYQPAHLRSSMFFDAPKSAVTPKHYLRGLRLVLDLKNRGVHVSGLVLAKALCSQLWKLFGSGGWSRNIKKCPFTLEEMLISIDKEWPGFFLAALSRGSKIRRILPDHLLDYASNGISLGSDLYKSHRLTNCRVLYKPSKQMFYADRRTIQFSNRLMGHTSNGKKPRV